MPGENLSEGNLASGRDGSRDFRGNGEERRVLTPIMGQLKPAFVSSVCGVDTFGKLETPRAAWCHQKGFIEESEYVLTGL